MLQESQKSVLVVDDDTGIRAMLIELLEDSGYHVSGAANGREALAQLQSGAQYPCLILLDLNMPVMTGWEFRSRQQQDPALAEIPVVVVSADRNIHYESRVVDAAGYLSKPIDFGRLMDLLDLYCC